MMITIETIKALANNDGLTLKGWVAIEYKSGYQVADYGVVCKTPAEVVDAISAMGGDCGIWYSDGLYYVDHSFRIRTRKEAVKIGKEFNQISILRWRDKSLIFC